jgi:sporulation protein YlmC with PRC-barrel domain
VGTLDIETALEWRGRTVIDRDGEKIGTLKEIYLDEAERPSWGSIHTALFGLRQTLVPLPEARLEGDELRVPYAREHVKDAPNMDPDVQLTPEEEQRLYTHYGTTGGASDEQAQAAEEPQRQDPDAPGEGGAVAAGREPQRQDPDAPGEGGAVAAGKDAMTRSEEEVRIGKRTRERRRARLKKYVVTDYVEKKIPVKREEVRLEREPPAESNDE